VGSVQEKVKTWESQIPSVMCAMTGDFYRVCTRRNGCRNRYSDGFTDGISEYTAKSLTKHDIAAIGCMQQPVANLQRRAHCV